MNNDNNCISHSKIDMITVIGAVNESEQVQGLEEYLIGNTSEILSIHSMLRQHNERVKEWVYVCVWIKGMRQCSALASLDVKNKCRVTIRTYCRRPVQYVGTVLVSSHFIMSMQYGTVRVRVGQGGAGTSSSSSLLWYHISHHTTPHYTTSDQTISHHTVSHIWNALRRSSTNSFCLPACIEWVFYFISSHSISFDQFNSIAT